MQVRAEPVRLKARTSSGMCEPCGYCPEARPGEEDWLSGAAGLVGMTVGKRSIDPARAGLSTRTTARSNVTEHLLHQPHASLAQVAARRASGWLAEVPSTPRSPRDACPCAIWPCTLATAALEYLRPATLAHPYSARVMHDLDQHTRAAAQHIR